MHKCFECGVSLTLNGGAISTHINKYHNLNLFDYVMKHYTRIGEVSNNYKWDHKKCEILFKPEKTLACLICNKKLTNNSSYLESHLKRIHGIEDYGEYYIKYYTNMSGQEIDKIDNICGLCEVEKVPFKSLFDVNHDTKTYTFKEKIHYSCGTEKCKHETSMRILGIPYDKDSYESIGSRSEYLALVHKKSIDYVKENMKYGEQDESKPYRTNLEDYCIRHGEELGKQLYEERNRKIGRANTIEYYIEKYGKELGEEKFKIRIEKSKRATLGTVKSKVQDKFYNDVIIKIDPDCLIEYPFDTNNLQRRTDFYSEHYDTHIEFFGDYWHASRKIFSPGDIHRTLKIPVEELWEKDDRRIKELTTGGSNVIIIWESTYNEYSKSGKIDELTNIIKDILNAGYSSKSFRL